MSNDLIYVYCISHPPPGPTPEVESTELKTIAFEGFHIFVKYVSESDFSEENLKRHLSDLEWLETNAREHIRIISMIMADYDVIPFKFGTIFNTIVGLEKFITDYAGSMLENFDHIKGKEEWAVKIYCDRKKLIDQIDLISKEAAEMEAQIMASSPGKAFLLRRKKTDFIENEMDRICKKYSQEYYEVLNNQSESTYLNNLLPQEYTGKDTTMILNATFLIDKSKVSAFTGVIEMFKNRDLDTGFYIEESGPWPPFSFIYIKEK